jgi:pimeloyl-ACP methyl ester carboxylesterase
MLARDPIGPGYAFGTGRPLDQSNVVIDDVWFIDELSHSVSADLNAGFLGTAEIWTDVARDIVNFIVHVLPSADVRYQLDWAPAGVTKRVYGLGASFGGAAQLIAAAYRPELFEGVMLVDGMTAPRVNSLGDYLTNGLGPFFRTGDALKRRDRWPSRQAARQALSQALFFQKWDPAMFDLYISHGLVPVDNDRPDRAVRLATAPWSEAIIFCEPFEAARGWDLLPKVQVPVGFLMAADPERTMGESITREVVWRPPLSRNERSRTAEHLIIQQNPREVADSAWRFLQTMSAGWGTREQILDDYQIAKL